MPVPVPALVTLSANVVAELLKVAVTARAAVIDTVQAPVPVQAPLQPANVRPGAGIAVSVTWVPEAYVARSGERLTVPVPAGFVVTVTVNVPGTRKCAMTVFDASTVTTIGLSLPDASPDQWWNCHPEPGCAVSVTGVPGE